MPTTVIERPGSLSAVGLAKEAVFGTIVAANMFVPDTSCNLDEDPGLFYPQVMMGQKDVNIFPLYGQWKVSGTVAGPLFPTNGLSFLSAAVGLDGGSTGSSAPQPGVTGTTSGTPTTTSAAAAAGATSVTLTAATGIIVGTVIQIDLNATTTVSECRPVSAIAGMVASFITPLNFAHASAVAVQPVIAPYTHTMWPTNGSSPSFTIEKNTGGFESLQFAGCKISKYTLKCDATNTEVNFSSDVIGQSAAVLTTPTGITVINEAPYVFAEATVTLFGTPLLQVSSIEIDIDDGLKDTFTLNGTHTLQFLTQTSRHISGQMDVVWNSFDDASYGYWNKMFAQVSGALQLVFAHPANGGTVTVNLPQVRLSKYDDSIKINDIVMTTLNFEAEFNLGGSAPHTISAVVLNSSPLPF